MTHMRFWDDDLHTATCPDCGVTIAFSHHHDQDRGYLENIRKQAFRCEELD